MDYFTLLDSIQTIARNGLCYATDEYDRERYERLLHIATQAYAGLLSVPEAELRARFIEELGYITPKIGTDAAIFNENGEILLMDRSDGSGWCLPCGFVEPDETPAEGVVREVREETGLEVSVKRLVGVFTRKAGALSGPHTTVSIVHLCEITGGELKTSHEGCELRYWAIGDAINWHAAHEIHARAAYTMWNSEEIIPAISA